MMTGMPAALILSATLKPLGTAPEHGLELLLPDELDGQFDVLGLLDDMMTGRLPSSTGPRASYLALTEGARTAGPSRRGPSAGDSDGLAEVVLDLVHDLGGHVSPDSLGAATPSPPAGLGVMGKLMSEVASSLTAISGRLQPSILTMAEMAGKVPPAGATRAVVVPVTRPVAK